MSAGHIFISYSRTDSSYVERLVAYLTGAGIRVWHDNDVTTGDLFPRRIEEAIAQSAGFVVVITPETAKSTWVRREINCADSLNKVILPLLLAPTLQKPIEVAGSQYEDVTDGRMPGRKFVELLRRLIELGTNALMDVGLTGTTRLDATLRSTATEAGYGWTGRIPANIFPATTAAASRLVRTLSVKPRWPYRIWRAPNCVHGLACTSDHQLIAAATADGAARVWNPATGENLCTITGHRAAVYALAFSPNNKHLATASGDGTAGIWTVTGELIWSIPGPLGASVNGIAYSPDGTKIGMASQDGTVGICDATTGRLLSTFSGRGGAIHDIAFCPNSAEVATASHDGIARIWSLTGQHLLTLTGHHTVVNAVAYSPDGNYLATASFGGTVRIWQRDTGKNVLILPSRHEPVFSLAFSSDAAEIATASQSGAHIWNPDTGEHLHTLAVGHAVGSLIYSPKNTHLATGSRDGTIHLWRLNRDRADQRADAGR